MVTVEFTKNLARHVECPSKRVAGATVAEALDAYFAEIPAVKAYVLDEQGAVRHHVVVFVDGAMVPRKQALAEPLSEGSVVSVMQALSGG